jgi:hypothetical protein
MEITKNMMDIFLNRYGRSETLHGMYVNRAIPCLFKRREGVEINEVSNLCKEYGLFIAGI